MAQCYDSVKHENVYCTSNMAIYISLGIIIPACVLAILAVISLYNRCKRRRLRRRQQQCLSTVLPLENDDEQQQPPYNYSYPPHYSEINNGLNDKPPAYEQIVQKLSGANYATEEPAAVLPYTTPAAFHLN